MPVVAWKSFCGYMAFMPNALGVDTTDAIRNAVWSVQHKDANLRWIESRKRDMNVPNQGTLHFLEATCYIDAPDSGTAEQVLDKIAQDVMAKHPAVVGNAEKLHHLACPIPLKDCSTLDMTVVADSDGLFNSAEAAEKINDTGVLFLRGALSSTVTAQFRAAFDRYFSLASKALAGHGLDLTKPFRFHEVVSRGGGRAEIRFPLNDELTTALTGVDVSELQRFAAEQAPWGAAVQAILGDGVSLVRIGTTVSTSQCKAESDWHIDGEYTGNSADFNPESSASKATRVTVLLPLVNLTDTTGCTQFWPRSHKYAGLLDTTGEIALPGDLNGTGEVGDAIIVDSRLVRRGLPNKSGADCPVFYFVYSNDGTDSVAYPGPDARLLQPAAQQ